MNENEENCPIINIKNEHIHASNYTFTNVTDRILSRMKEMKHEMNV